MKNPNEIAKLNKTEHLLRTKSRGQGSYLVGGGLLILLLMIMLLILIAIAPEPLWRFHKK